MKGSLILIVFFVFMLNLNGQAIDSLQHALSQSFRSFEFVKPDHQNLFLKFNPKILPIFCRMEHYLDKVTPVQVRFRLGSLDYTNMLESKN